MYLSIQPKHFRISYNFTSLWELNSYSSYTSINFLTFIIVGKIQDIEYVIRKGDMK